MTFSKQEYGAPGQRIMVVVAHPDDAEFMCSGSIAKWVREGSEAVYIIATNGNKGTSDRNVDTTKLAKIREAEQRDACALLGATEVEFLGHEDGMLQNTLELRRQIVSKIRTHRPTAVVTENPTRRWDGNYINHPDHRAIGDATMDAVFPSARDFHMWPEMHHDLGLEPHIVSHLYLGMSGEGANVHIDITETIDLKIRALKAHVSQVGNQAQELDHFVRSMAQRSKGESGLNFAESFRYFFLGGEET